MVCARGEKSFIEMRLRSVFWASAASAVVLLISANSAKGDFGNNNNNGYNNGNRNGVNIDGATVYTGVFDPNNIMIHVAQNMVSPSKSKIKRCQDLGAKYLLSALYYALPLYLLQNRFSLAFPFVLILEEFAVLLEIKP